MLSHYPCFRKGALSGLVHKIGGLPWGFPVERWPVCEECGQPMSHLAQFPARAPEENAPVLPIAEDTVLFIFKCEGENICSFWESDSGANAVLSLARRELGDHATHPPVHTDGDAPVLVPELGVASWRVANDGAPAELEPAFYDYGSHNDLPEEIAYPHGWASEWCTKFGGVPYWTPNGAQQIPPGRFLLQIDNFVPMEDGSGEEFANFCSDGTAFIFIDVAQTPPIFSMIINR